MKIAIAQLNSNDDVPKNLNTILEMVERASGLPVKPEIIFFPENSLYFRIRAEDTPVTISESAPELRTLIAASLQSKIALHITTPVSMNGDVFNASILIRDGVSEFIYRKIHLFDISLEGQKPILESAVFKNGQQPSSFAMGPFRFGSTICYDIRFAELFSIYAAERVDAVVIPSAFLVRTGQAHWMTLLRARAIESQCYVIAPAQQGKHIARTGPADFRETFGHSAVIDPWGDVISLSESGTGLSYADLSKDRINSVRKQMPMATHRRL
jgi:deaminated glutathione amidase